MNLSSFRYFLLTILSELKLALTLCAFVCNFFFLIETVYLTLHLWKFGDKSGVCLYQIADIHTTAGCLTVPSEGGSAQMCALCTPEKPDPE